MNVLLVFSLLLVRRRRQVVVVLATESLLRHSQYVMKMLISVCHAYQVVIGEVGNVTRLNAEVLEGLGFRIDDLIHEFSLDLICRHCVPPESLVENLSNGLQHRLGDIEMSALLEDFLVNKVCNLSHAVLLRSVELKGLSSGGVIIEHLLKSGTDID